MCGRYVTLDEATIERAYSLTAMPCGTCVREHSGEHPPKSRPSRHRGRAGSAHGRPHGGGPSAPRVCTPERWRADAGPARAGTDAKRDDPALRHRPKFQSDGRSVPRPAAADSPPVMPETRCVLKKWGWWPGAESFGSLSMTLGDACSVTRP